MVHLGGGARIKLLVLDLDGTLWDHLDISSTKPPYVRLDDDLIEDSEGNRIRLFPGVREFLREVRGLGIAVAVASWNERDVAVKAMEALSIIDYFDFLSIKPTPRMDLMISEIMEWYHRELGEVRDEEVLYVDDRDIHVGEVRHLFPGIQFALMWRDFRDFRELLNYLRGGLKP